MSSDEQRRRTDGELSDDAPTEHDDDHQEHAPTVADAVAELLARRRRARLALTGEEG